MQNPFITYGYESADYFCDRRQETQQLLMLLTNVHIGASGLHLRMYHDSYKQRFAVTQFSPLQRGS